MMRDKSELTTDGGAVPGGGLASWDDLLAMVLERRWIAITVCVAIVTITALWTFRQAPRYQATARIQVDLVRQNVLNMPDVSSAEPYFLYNNFVNTLIREIKGRTFVERVAQHLTRDPHPALAGATDLPGLVMAAIDVRPVKDSRLVDITAEEANPDVAALLANTVAEQFVALNLERRVTDASDAVAWLREQVDDQREKLALSEIALRDYRDRTRTVSLEQRQDIVVAKLKSISETLTAAEMDRIDAETRWREVEALGVDVTGAVEVAALANDPVVAAVRQQIRDKQAEISGLQQRYKEEHPTMRQLAGEIEALEARLRKVCGEAREALATRLSLTRSNEEALRQALRQQEEQALALDRLMVEYEALKRNADADRELYDALLTRLKETDVAGKLETNNLRLIERAVIPLRPFKPNKPMNMARGVAAGVILGVLAAFLVGLADDRVHLIRAHGGPFGAPLLAVIPRVVMPNDVQRARTVLDAPSGAPAEAFRSLRANLMLLSHGRLAKRILVSGTGMGDGKSLVAINLAMVLASHGERTLLIDADLRRPSILRAFPEQGPPEIHPLTHDIELSQAVRATAMPNLHVLVPGAPLPNPAELLASPRMRALLDSASAAYDRVIIDSPPLFSVSDPVILLPGVDGVILVARYGKTRQRPIQDALRLLADAHAPMLGLVLNSVSPRQGGYYYQHYYSRYDENRSETGGPQALARQLGKGARRLWATVRGDAAPATMPPTVAIPVAAMALAPVPMDAATSGDRRLDDPVRYYEGLVARNARDEAAWTGLVEAHRLVGNLAPLEDVLARLRMARMTDESLSYVVEGHIAYQKRNYEKAATAYREALRRNPRSLPAAEGCARTDLMIGDLDNASRMATRLLRDDGRNATGLYVAGSLRIFSQDPAGAIDALSRSIAVSADPEALNNLAWLMLEAGDLEQARELATRAVSVNASLAAAWDTLGAVLLRKGLFADAARTFELAHSLAPDNIGIAVSYADALWQAGHRGKAADLADRLRAGSQALSDDQRRVLARLSESTDARPAGVSPG